MNKGTQRKRRRNRQQIRELLARYHRSGTTQAEFVTGEGICLATLQRYLKTDGGSRSKEPGGFVEIDRTGSVIDFRGRDFYRVCLREGVGLEIPAGFAIREVASLLELVLGMEAR